ncbi:hypothetical protein SAY86_021240 [Trapa natans]|uniref:Uncharacterized protein n=1 Tax=Trapa natans TaxID=22666 RepID=A0AAN7MYR6_TRANT|nr:hypothetical protein SAY86_021240 [Trapa natans]
MPRREVRAKIPSGATIRGYQVHRRCGEDDTTSSKGGTDMKAAQRRCSSCELHFGEGQFIGAHRSSGRGKGNLLRECQSSPRLALSRC